MNVHKGFIIYFLLICLVSCCSVTAKDAVKIDAIKNVNGDSLAYTNQSILIKTKEPLNNPDNARYILYINDIPFSSFGSSTISSTSFRFDLDAEVLAETFYKIGAGNYRFAIGIDKGSVLTETKEFSLLFHNCIATFISVLLMILLIVMIFKFSKIWIKDSEENYSLSSAILLGWTVIIFSSIVYLSLSNLSPPLLNETVFALLGISGFNKVVSNTMGLSNSQNFKQILSDEASEVAQAHRFQMLLFNILYGVIFLFIVFTRFHLPSFDSNVLLLLGISDVTYLGVKFRNTSPASQGSNISRKE